MQALTRALGGEVCGVARRAGSATVLFTVGSSASVSLVCLDCFYDDQQGANLVSRIFTLREGIQGNVLFDEIVIALRFECITVLK